MKAYYAHCVAIYNTPQEKRDIETIEKLGFEVVNPNNPECDAGYKEHGMKFFFDYTATCDLVFFRALPHGKIPAGIFKEIDIFQKRGQPVIELPSGIKSRGIDVEQTREYLSECGQR